MKGSIRERSPGHSYAVLETRAPIAQFKKDEAS